MNTPIRRIPAATISLMLGAGLIACSDNSEIANVDIQVPPGARIGNIATAKLDPVGDSGVSGIATFASLTDGLRIEATVSGLSGGSHGLHIHEVGDCSAPDASSAGGHLTPDEDPHGAPSDAPAAHHAGDLGNLTADPGGMAHVIRDDPELAMIGEFGVVGRAIIVHSESDDFRSQPGGDAGERIACGVIQWGTNAVTEGDGSIANQD